MEKTGSNTNDVVVMVNSRTDMQDVAKRWWHEMNENGIKINTQKGKKEVLAVSSNSRHTFDVLIGEDKVHQVANYTYLGVKELS